jgi:hypothetical protein
MPFLASVTSVSTFLMAPPMLFWHYSCHRGVNLDEEKFT